MEKKKKKKLHEVLDSCVIMGDICSELKLIFRDHDYKKPLLYMKGNVCKVSGLLDGTMSAPHH